MKITPRLRIILLSFSICSLFGLLFADYGDSTTPSSRKGSASKSIFKKVAAGDTVYGILKKTGFDRESTNAALSENILPSSFSISPGDVFEVVRVKDPQKTIVRFFDDFKYHTYEFWRSTQKGAGAKVSQTAFTKKNVSVSGRIVGSIVGSIRQSTGDSLLGYRFMDAYQLDYNLRKEVQKNAKYSITYQKLYSGNQFIRNGQILSASLEIDNKIVKRKFVPTENGGVFLDPDNLQTNRPLYAPVAQIRISSLYQPRRFHPVRKVRRAHLGIDFELPTGEKIYASASGRILRLGRNRGAGNYVVIRHANGLETYYNHMSKIAKNLKKNQKISAGTVIGEIGCTGLCTKPHLHFAIKKHGKYVDPVKYIRGYSFQQRSVASNN